MMSACLAATLPSLRVAKRYYTTSAPYAVFLVTRRLTLP